MTDRDTLAEFAWEQLAGPGSVGETAAEIRYSADQVADIAIAAGWRPPAQVIETPEALDALPIDSVVFATRSRTVWQNMAEPVSLWGNGSSGLTARTLLHNYGSVVVLYLPTERPTGE
jgi:hypothetical protein